MATIPVLVDTDILIDDLHRGSRHRHPPPQRHVLDSSVVTRKERRARENSRTRHVARSPIRSAASIAARDATVRQRYPRLERDDAVIAATALDK